MKSFQKTLLFAVFVLALALFSYFVVYQGSQREEERKEKASLLLQASSDQVTELHLKRMGNTIRLVKTGTEWKMVEPVEYLADNTEIPNFLNSLLLEKSMQVVREGAGINWSVYGLDQPEGSLALKFQDGTSKTMVIGSRRTYDNDLYLRFENEDRVYLVGATWSGLLHRDAKTFRDKRILLSSTSDISELQLTVRDSGKTTTSLLALNKGKWQFADPTVEVADETIQEWLRNFSELRAIDFTFEDKSKAKDLGELAIDAKLILAEKDPKQKATVDIKIYENKDNYSLLVSNLSPVFRLNKMNVDKLRFVPGDFRDKKKPFAFKVGDVAKVQYRSALFNAQIEKVSQGKWVLRTGGKPGDEIVSSEMENLLKAVSQMQAREFVPLAQVRGVGKNEITLRDVQDRVLFSFKWGETYKTQKHGANLDLTYVVTNLEKEGLGVETSAIRGIPGQTLLQSKPSAPSNGQNGSTTQAPTNSSATDAAKPTENKK